MALTCPNTSHPDWKALEARVGRRNAMKLYAQNGNKIPKITNEAVHTAYDNSGQVFKRADTMDRLDQNPTLSRQIVTKLKELYPNVNIFEGGLFDEKGNWRQIPPGEVGMHRRNAFVGAVAWANDAYLETPPHEYAHEYIEMFREHPLIQEGIRRYGEENLAIYMGKDFATWVIDGKTGKRERTLMNEIWHMIKSFFGVQDVREMIADNFRRGRMLSSQVHPGTGVYNYQERTRVLARPDGSADLGNQFEKSTIEAGNIDDEMSKFYMAREMTGRAVMEFRTSLEDGVDGPRGFVDDTSDINIGKAQLYFENLVTRLRAIDTEQKGGQNVYTNRAGLDKRRLKDFVDYVNKDAKAKELVEHIMGLSDTPPTGQDLHMYNMALTIMKRMNYVQKYKDSVIADKGKMVSLNAVTDQISNEVRQTATRREQLYTKVKHPGLRKLLKSFEKNILRYFLHPMLTSKFLSGSTNSTLHRLFYESLDNAETNRVKYLSEFRETIQGEMPEGYKNWSSHNRRGMNIDQYEGQTFELFVKEDPRYATEESPNGDLQNVKLTNAEIMSVYMTLRQNTDQSGMSPPATAIAKNGFYLDDTIAGREYTNTTKFMFGENTANQIMEIVHSNPDMMKMVARIDTAMAQMHNHANETFYQENGYDLPNLPNYFPVYTGNTEVQIAKGKNTISSFRSLKARLGEDVPLKIADVNKVNAVYSNHASLYASHAIPIANNRKMIQRIKPGYTGKQEEVYFDQIEGYLNRLEDPSYMYANQGEKEATKWFNRVTSNFAVSVLAMNLPVMAKQPVSYLAAKEEIDSKYLRQAGWGIGGVTGISPRQIMRSLKYTGVKGGETLIPVEWNLDTNSPEYKAIVANSPKLKYRLEGAINRELGEAMIAEQTEADKIVLPRWMTRGKRVEISKSRLMEGIKIFDSATIMSIWKAVELETAEQHPQLQKGSKEYNEHVARRTEDIVNKTQPTYDLMNRTEMSQLSNPVLRMLSMFGSARSKLGTTMIDGMISTINDWTPENRKKLLKRSFNIMALNAIAITAIDAMREGLLGGFDDDDEIIDYLTYGTVGTSMGAFYGVSEATRIAISRIDNQPWSAQLQHPIEALGTESVNAVTDIFRIGKTNKTTGKYDYTIDDGLWNATKVLMKGTGIPLTPFTYPEKAYKNSLED